MHADAYEIFARLDNKRQARVFKRQGKRSCLHIRRQALDRLDIPSLIINPVCQNDR